MNKLKALVFSTLIVYSCFTVGCTNKFAEEKSYNDYENYTNSMKSDVDGDVATIDGLKTEKSNAEKLVSVLPNANFEGGAIRIAATNPEIFIPNMSGGIIDSSVYFRNKLVEEKYNVKIDAFQIGNLKNAKKALRNANLAETEFADFVSLPMKDISNFVVDGSLYNLKLLPFLNLKNAYFKNSLADTMTVNNKLYCLFGDAMQQFDYTYAMFFNKDHVDLESQYSPYNLQKKGEWTWEALMSNPLTITDLNATELAGEEVFSTENYRLGTFTNDRNYLNSVVESGDFEYLSKDEENILTINYKTQSMTDLIDLLSKIMVTENKLYKQENLEYADETSLFIDGKLTFMPAKLSSARTLINTKVNFGVLQMPKIDISQKNYHGYIEDAAIGISVPAYCPNTEKTGLVLNAFYAASDSHMAEAESLELINYCIPDNDSALSVKSIINSGKTNVSYMLYQGFPDVFEATGKIIENCIYNNADFINEYNLAKVKYSDYLKEIK